jgi:antitoxin ParD1/3/4
MSCVVGQYNVAETLTPCLLDCDRLQHFTHLFQANLTTHKVTTAGNLDFSASWHKMAISDIHLEPAMSLNVSLPPELENRVRQHVESGLYSSASEVIREALRLFEAYQGIQAANLAALKADIAQGVADINAGRVREVSMSSIKERGRAIRATPKAV